MAGVRDQSDGGGGRQGDRLGIEAAAPVDDRIFFAGEACSAESFSTAHGAWMTGERAADAVLAALKVSAGR